MADEHSRTQAYVLGKAKDVDNNCITTLLPTFLYGYTHRLLNEPCASLVSRFKRKFKPGDVVYFWLNSPVELVEQMRAQGMLIAREMINCTKLRVRRELQTAYEMLGRPDQSRISEEAIENERQELLAADVIFCPNEFVFHSVLEYGVSERRCIKTSYGWDPKRISHRPFSSRSPKFFTLLFVGTGNVRKGLPWLLRAWDQAGVRGRLLLAGSIDPELRVDHARILQRPDVVDLGYIKNISTAYFQADAFCFPSWEEGGPMVTIEAMGSGLPCIVTPMGSAGIIRGQEQGGIVVQSGDIDALVAAIRRLADNIEFRFELASSALRTSAAYTWEAVGERRLKALRAYS